MSLETTSVTFNGIVNVSQTTLASALRIGPSSGTDTGGWITSTAPNNLDITSGSKLNADALWVATQTDSTQVHWGGGNLEVFINHDLTIGETFIPNRRFYFAGNQILANNGGSASLPSYTNETYQDTGMFITSSPGIGLTAGGTAQIYIESNKLRPATPDSVSLGDIGKEFRDAFISRGVTIGIGGSAPINNRVTIDGSDLTDYGPAVYMKRAGVTVGGFGTYSSVYGSNSNTMVFYAVAALEIYTSTSSLGLSISTGGNSTFGGSITTSPPSGGTAAAWKLGTYTAGVVAQAGKVRIEIDGVPYDLLTA